MHGQWSFLVEERWVHNSRNNTMNLCGTAAHAQFRNIEVLHRQFSSQSYIDNGHLLQNFKRDLLTSDILISATYYHWTHYCIAAIYLCSSLLSLAHDWRTSYCVTVDHWFLSKNQIAGQPHIESMNCWCGLRYQQLNTVIIQTLYLIWFGVYTPLPSFSIPVCICSVSYHVSLPLGCFLFVCSTYPFDTCCW